MVEEQVVKLKEWVRYSGMIFEDIIFELKRLKFEKNFQSEYVVDDADENDEYE